MAPSRRVFSGSNSSCEHLAHSLESASSTKILSRYSKIVRWALKEKYRTSATYSSSEPASILFNGAHHQNGHGRPKMSPPECSECSLSLDRPFACLSCSFLGCWSSSSSTSTGILKGNHLVEHLAASDHSFGIDSSTGRIYCAQCADFVAHPLLESERTRLALREEDDCLALIRKAPSKRKRPLARSDPTFVPDEREQVLLLNANPLPCRGLRGFRNIGQTCFLSVILQSFVHNPLLRDYFLADRHNRTICLARRTAGKQKETDVGGCMLCELDRVFSEIYSEEQTPFGPITFLYSMWNSSADLAGYAQQDAHEFFIAALNQMHTDTQGLDSDCSCPIHTTFSGLLQSDVRCGSCGGITSAFDPMLDISLDLRNKGSEGKAGSEGNTLKKCLDRYTSPERLGQQYTCGKCGLVSSDSTKQLSIKKIPPVLCFQFKRFEHQPGSTSIKVESPVRFPSSIDMTPYLSQSIRTKLKKSSALIRGFGEEMIYDLVVVVCHQGQLNNGHYTNFARFREEWYYFDDEKVLPSTLGYALGSRAYMLTCVYNPSFLTIFHM
ncbi:cysteine proteinase [Phaffia rhodozyma]|uniref:Cysteine proteinase n=1 Tax=Phaffia rhodozyma TaxID=264483 RepID=A0A0F7SU48_PHARH|nr:cysteine proteinase [Phaffia rhodozyma]